VQRRRGRRAERRSVAAERRRCCRRDIPLSLFQKKTGGAFYSVLACFPVLELALPFSEREPRVF
jgi:hypothetical protein